VDTREVNIKTLAYIGDVVYELYIREHVIENSREQVNKLHKKTIKYVSAKAQAEILHKLEEKLTEDELDIVRRGRNSNPHSTAKNADVIDYKYATGFEALIGYLYLTKQNERLEELLGECVK